MRTLLTLALTLLVGGLAYAQDPDYVLSVGDASGATGDTVVSTVELDILGTDESAGWSYGVCHDTTHATLIDAVEGATTLVVKGGDPPDFSQINVYTEGYTIGVVISFLGQFTLAPGMDYELTDGSYELLGDPGTTSDMLLCDTLGSPTVAVVIVVNGASVAPVTEGGVLEVPAGPVEDFFFSTDNPTVDYPVASGSTAFDVTFYIEDTAAAPRDTQGFSMGLASDATFLAPGEPAVIGDVLALSPDFVGPAALADGFTIGVVYDFMGATFLQFATMTGVVSVNYTTNDASLIGVSGMTTTALTWDNTLGSPPVDNVVVVAGLSEDPVFVDGEVVLNGVSGPVPALFITGDGNGDGKFNLADPIYLLNFLFASGPASTCPAAMDYNGDGIWETDDAVLALNYLYLDGPDVAAPFPACGTRPGVMEADCDFAGCP